MSTPTSPAAFASIVWLAHSAGGRRTGPPTEGYTVPAHFYVPDDRWPEEGWSLVVAKESAPNDYEWIARVWFLVPEAPHHFLQSGIRFDLHEGARIVARGVILQADLGARDGQTG